MTGSEDAHISTLSELSNDELIRLLVEAEEYVQHFSGNVTDIRAELDIRVDRGEPYDYVEKLDGEDRMGMTVTVTKVKGAERWKYNPKAVMNRLDNLTYGDGYTKRTLDTSTFNKALTNNDDIYDDFHDIARLERSPDSIRITGMDKLLKARGLTK